MSLSKIIWFCVAAVVIPVFVVCSLIWDKKKCAPGSDERQVLMNGKCVSAGFYTMIVLNAISYVAVTAFGIYELGKVLFLISILAGAMMFFVFGIWKDTVFTKFWTKKRCLWVLALWIFAICYFTYLYVSKSVIDNLILSITCSAILVIVFVNFGLKYLYDKKQEKLDAQEE